MTTGMPFVAHLLDDACHRLAAPWHQQNAVDPAGELSVKRVALGAHVIGAEHGELDLDTFGLLDPLAFQFLSELDAIEIDSSGSQRMTATR